MSNWGNNSYNNQGGFYQGNSFGGGGFAGRGGRGRGNRRGGGGNNYNYNNNPEWYTDSYDNGGYNNGYNNGFNNGYNDNVDYGAYGGLPFPFRGRGNFRGGRGRGRGGFNPGWKRGGGKQQWVAPKIKKTINNAQIAAAAVSKKKKTYRQSEARTLKFKELMTLKNKYRSVRQNRHLAPDDQLALVLLKRIMNDTCEGDALVHCINFSKLASRHPSALKLFCYEAKKQLDLKYDPNVVEKVEERTKYLEEVKKDIIVGFKKVYKQRAEKEDMDAKEKLLDVYIKKISGETFTDADIPVEEDYLFDKNHSRSEEDFIREFTYDFVFNCYETFKFKPDESKSRIKDMSKRLRFHWEENPIIPFLVVESARSKTLVTAVPSPINKYIIQQNAVHQDKNEACLNGVVDYMIKLKENVVTPISKYIGSDTNTSTATFRDFADCILLFDRFATYIKLRLLKYSPHILLPLEKKTELFHDLIDKVYRKSLEILINDERLDTKEFVDMEPEEIAADAEMEVKDEPVEVKEEKMDAE